MARPSSSREPGRDLPDPLDPRPSPARLIGIDLARGCAVLGMYAVHVGPDPEAGGPLGFLMELAAGRSSALFAVLAGFTLVIITGRPRPRTGRAGRRAVARVVIRSVVLVVLGLALTALDTDVNVILAFYGLAFLIVLPLYRLSATRLAVVAAASALLLPQLLYVIRRSIDNGSWAETVIGGDPLARISGTDGFVELLFTGNYPVLTWMPFMIAGMAVARLDLRDARIRTRLALAGGALCLLGYGGSWLALRLVPSALGSIAAATHHPVVGSAWWSDRVVDLPDRAPAAWLLVAAPHSETTFSILGNTGVALVVMAVCLMVADRMPRLTRLAAPVAAIGTVALTAYVLQILAIGAVPLSDGTGSALLALLVFTAAAALLATLWTRRFRRGPLEHLLHRITGLGRHIK